MNLIRRKKRYTVYNLWKTNIHMYAPIQKQQKTEKVEIIYFQLNKTFIYKLYKYTTQTYYMNIHMCSCIYIHVYTYNIIYTAL